MNRLGIIQGRLSLPVGNRIQAFPPAHWWGEFALCKELGIDCIEWIFDYERSEDNPLCSDTGIKQILRLTREHEVAINSVLADYFMVKRLFGEDEQEVCKALDVLHFLIAQCHTCRIPIIEIPFVDTSALKTEDDKQEVIRNLKKPLRYADDYGIKISLETSLPPAEFKQFILAFKSPAVKVNYDMGNSASLGYDPHEEIGLLGEYIVNVHIKDRVRGGGTVPLGRGDTDFHSIFQALKKKKYRGDFILQGARQDLDGQKTKKDIKATIHEYLNFVRPFLREFE